MEFVKYEIKLDHLIAGFPTHALKGPGELEIQIKGFATPDDNGRLFYRMLESSIGTFLGPYLKDGKHFVSEISDCLVLLHKDKKATVYINPPLSIEMQMKKSVEKGQLIYKDDIADVCDFKIHDVDIGDNEGVLFYFQVGWRQALYYDFLPPDGRRREVPVEKELARFWAMLTFGEIFSLTSEDYSKLFNLGWFPFISIKKGLFQKLVDCIKNDFDPESEIKNILDSVDESLLDTMLERFKNCEFLKDEIPFIENGINHYKNKDYIACVSVLWPRIEGSARKLVTSTKKRIGQQEVVKAISGHVLKKHPHSTLYLPQEFAEYLNEFFFKNFCVEPGEKDKSLSRHTHSHGVSDSDSYTQEKALIGLLIFDQISWYTK
jgi:hypothetical protein